MTTTAIPQQSLMRQEIKLTRQQAVKLAKETTALAHWITVRDFAAQIYGSQATKVEIDSYDEYGDESRSLRIEVITAYDKDGDELEPDFTLPFFALEECKGAHKYWNESADIVDLLNDIDIDSKNTWVLIEDLPVTGGTYDLLTVPVISQL